MSVCDYCGENGECHQGRWYALGNEHKEAERAVIEAAEPARKAWRDNNDSTVTTVAEMQKLLSERHRTLMALWAAVDALAELETEPPVPLDKVKTWEGERPPQTSPRLDKNGDEVMSYSRWGDSDWYTYSDVNGGFTVCGVLDCIPTERIRNDIENVLKEVDAICKNGEETFAPREGYDLEELRGYMLEHLEEVGPND